MFKKLTRNDVIKCYVVGLFQFLMLLIIYFQEFLHKKNTPRWLSKSDFSFLNKNDLDITWPNKELFTKGEKKPNVKMIILAIQLITTYWANDFPQNERLIIFWKQKNPQATSSKWRGKKNAKWLKFCVLKKRHINENSSTKKNQKKQKNKQPLQIDVERIIGMPSDKSCVY